MQAALLQSENVAGLEVEFLERSLLLFGAGLFPTAVA